VRGSAVCLGSVKRGGLVWRFFSRGRTEAEGGEDRESRVDRGKRVGFWAVVLWSVGLVRTRGVWAKLFSLFF
jgi:hypothetical protein